MSARARAARTTTTASPGKGWAPVYRVVRRVPSGCVATYGQVAALAGMPGAARQVGWALHAVSEADEVPWHRVLNAKGEISPRGSREIEALQRALLEHEGIEFDTRGRVSLERYAWHPRKRRARSPSSPASERPTKSAAQKGARHTERRRQEE